MAFDYRTGSGEIAGEDGRRYKFVGTEWKPTTQPRSGQRIDFEPEADEARAIYSLAPATPAGAAGEPNRFVAGLLALLLGGLGVHKFYMGKNKAGVVMLLVSIFGIILLFLPTIIIALIAFVEAIIYFLSSDEAFHEKYVVGDQSWF